MRNSFMDELMEKNRGVLVGCDQNQEWLLSWWFSHFRKTNPDLPVAFADFGMSPKAKVWCEERGLYLEAPVVSVPSGKEERGLLFMGERWREWRSSPRTTTYYPIWFSKAPAMLMSPFDRTLWLDLDCQVRKDLSSLFSLPLPKSKLRMRKGSKMYVKSYPSENLFLILTYNGGVVLFEKDSLLLKMWSDANREGSQYFFGDDSIVSLFICCLKNENISLPFKYNWNATQWGENPEAFIYHWEKDAGKNKIYLQCLESVSV